MKFKDVLVDSLDDELSLEEESSHLVAAFKFQLSLFEKHSV